MKLNALVIFIVCLSFAALGQTPLSKNGALRVQNSMIVNRNGHPPQLRGVSLFWSIWGQEKYYNPAVINWLAADF
jgi:endoglucanase